MERSKAQLDRELILRSIFEKWNPICLGCHIDRQGDDCPLCQEYRRGCNACVRCPVAIKVGVYHCLKTPYIGYYRAKTKDEFYLAEEKIVEFLISLLDKETQENLEEIFILWCKIKEAKNAENN